MSGQREWKPGDVAMLSLPADASHGPARLAEDGWRCFDDDYLHRAGDVLDARPLVVIDPEDDGQIDRLYRLLVEQDYTYDKETPRELRHALREFANPTPPKPEEPLGLYARVEDVEGGVWVRTATQASVWRRECVNSGGFRYLIPQDGCEDYSDIDAVRVLSPGYTEDGAS